MNRGVTEVLLSAQERKMHSATKQSSQEGIIKKSGKKK